MAQPKKLTHVQKIANAKLRMAQEAEAKYMRELQLISDAIRKEGMDPETWHWASMEILRQINRDDNVANKDYLMRKAIRIARSVQNIIHFM